MHIKTLARYREDGIKFCGSLIYAKHFESIKSFGSSRAFHKLNPFLKDSGA